MDGSAAHTLSNQGLALLKKAAEQAEGTAKTTKKSSGPTTPSWMP